MSNNFGTPIPWPFRMDFTQNAAVADELDRVTSDNYVLSNKGYMEKIALCSTVNGLESQETLGFIHNATIVAMQQLEPKHVAQLTPAHIRPIVSITLNSSNAAALRQPNILPGKDVDGLKPVVSIGSARGEYLNVRSQDSAPIQEYPEYIRSLGYANQPYQPFAWLFVRKDEGIDTLYRIRNPFETTLFLAAKETLQKGLSKGASQVQPAPGKFKLWRGFGSKK